MSVMTTFQQGFFNWVDLLTTDPEAAKEVLPQASRLGSSGRPPRPQTSAYTMFNLGEHSAAGLCKKKWTRTARTPAAARHLAGLAPSRWMTAGHGQEGQRPRGATAGHGRTVRCDGCWCQGHMQAIRPRPPSPFWQARKHRGAEVVNDVGAMSWHELIVRPGQVESFLREGLRLGRQDPGTWGGWTTPSSPSAMPSPPG